MVERTPRRWTEFISLRMSRKDPAFRRYDKFEVDSIARELGLRWLRLTAHLGTRDANRLLAFLESPSADTRWSSSSRRTRRR